MAIQTINAQTIRELGSDVVQQLGLTARLTTLYSIDHPNTAEALSKLDERLRAFLDANGRMTVRLDSGYVFVNDVRLRDHPSLRQALTWLAERFDAASLLTLSFLPEVRPLDLKRMLPLLMAAKAAGDEPSALPRDLREAEIDAIRVRIQVPGSRAEGGDRFVLEAHALAAAVFLRLRQVSAELVIAVRDGQPIVLRDAKLAVQRAADLLHEDSATLLTLTAARNAPADEDVYLSRHMANVCTLSLAIGLSLGLTRQNLLELGCAALSYDAGMSRVSAQLRRQPRALTEQERVEVSKHTERGAEVLLGCGDGTSAAYVAAVVAARHHDGQPGYDALVGEAPSSLYSEIISVADAYDAMLWKRPHHGPVDPGEALRSLLANPKTCTLAKILASVAGVYPMGCLVELDTGEVAVVGRADPEAGFEAFSRPIVKVILDSVGHSVDGISCSLVDKDEEGNYARSIVRVLDASAMEVEVDDLLAVM